MNVPRIARESGATTTSVSAARVAVAASIATVLLLFSLHVVSPEFDPAWRMVSEYAYGHYGWVLSLMFLAWAISSWASAVALASHAPTKAGRVGLYFLVIAGIGAALAAVFDIRHDVGHGIASVLGIGGFPVAAVLLSLSLGRLPAWRGIRRPLLWLANLSWISILLMIAALALMTSQMLQVTGGNLPAQAPTALPTGVIGLVGWANRLLILVFCAWSLVASWHAVRLADSQTWLSGEMP